MKICWDNIENAKLSKCGDFVIKKHRYVEKESCSRCNKPYLMSKYKSTSACCTACGSIGKKVTASVRIKISKTSRLNGVNRGNKNAMYGKKFSVSHRRKISKGCKGKNVGLKNGMYGRCGLLSPVWRGGISCEPYCYEWSFKEFKDLIKERDGHRCLNPYCFGNYERLCIHHIDYNKKNCEPDNLITLCISCNGRANKDRDWHKAWYKAIINRRYGGTTNG